MSSELPARMPCGRLARPGRDEPVAPKRL